MMLDWLEEHESADKIRQAVHTALRQQAVRNPDLGGQCRTSDMTDAILSELI